MKTLLLTLLLSTSLISVSYANYKDGKDAYKQGNYKAAIKEFKSLADQDNAEAQNFLGLMYAIGKGVPRDSKEALKWYLKAANQGNPTAQNNLGMAHQQGSGTLKDDGKAIKWYRKSADQGNAAAQHRLGRLYSNSRSKFKDLSKAKHWIKKAYENLNANIVTVKEAKASWKRFELWKY